MKKNFALAKFFSINYTVKLRENPLANHFSSFSENIY